MMKRTKSRDTSALRALLTGLLVSTVSFFACMLIATLILFLGDDPTYKSELFSFGAMLISGAIAGFITSRMRGEGGTLIATLAALALVLLLFIIGTVSTGLPSLPSVINYAIYVGISAVAAFLGRPREKHRHR